MKCSGVTGFRPANGPSGQLEILPWANYTADRLLADIQRKLAAPPSPTP